MSDCVGTKRDRSILSAVRSNLAIFSSLELPLLWVGAARQSHPAKAVEALLVYRRVMGPH
jgi:hypothetical protein